MIPEIEHLNLLLAEWGAEAIHLHRGETLIQQGEAGDTFYVVKRGRLRAIYNRGLEDERVVGEAGRGEPVGEMALLGEGKRAASVFAIRDSELLVVTRELFARLLEAHPRVVIELMRFVAMRMRTAPELGPRLMQPNCIAIVPANHEAPLEDYCRRLAETLPEITGSHAFLSSESLRAEVSKPTGAGQDPETAEKLRLGRWLDEQEAAVDTLVLQSDFELTPWTRLCVRQADLILVIGKAGTDPHPGPIEYEWERLCEPVARPVCDLVLLQDGMPYRGTARWLQPRAIRRHYHVQMDSELDRERGRRLLSGRDVTLVLGGGGARGFAHIGVVRACRELGIPIDRIGGTSMGAVIAGCVAQGLSWEEIREKMRESFLDGGSLRSRTIPFLSIDTGKRFLRMLERLFGDTQIEDLPINYFCISCNLTQAKSVIHREGSLAKWVGASMTVPGFAPPIAEGGDLLVDGGLLNNLPADIAKADGTGLVIGVDVSPEVDLRVAPDYTGRPGVLDIVRFWFAAKRKPGSVKPFPGLFAVLNRATTLSSVYRKESLKKMTDVYLKLPVSNCRIFEWKRLDELVETGYQTALEQLKNFDAEYFRHDPASTRATGACLRARPPTSS